MFARQLASLFGVAVTALACGSLPQATFQPAPPLGSASRTSASVAVVDFDNWNPPSGGDPAAGVLIIPGWLWVSYPPKYFPSGIARCVYSDLSASRAFRGVDYLEDWGREPLDVSAYDVVVTGRLLRNEYRTSQTTFGLSFIGIIPALLGVPDSSKTRVLEFEMTAFLGSDPGNTRVKKAVLIEQKTLKSGGFSVCPEEELRPVFDELRVALVKLAHESHR